MIEPQGLGLHRWREPTGVRVVAWLRQRHAPVEWPLMQSLCDVLARLGHPATVVDALSPETNDQPGLAQWVAYGQRPELRRTNAPRTAPPTGLPPAAAPLPRLRSHFGLKALIDRQQQGEGSAARALAQALRDTPVVIVMALPDLGLPLLADSAVLPVLAVRGAPEQAVYAYEMLKAATHATHTDALVACAASPDGQPSLAQALRACMRHFLHSDVDTLPLPLNRHGQWEPEAAARLARELLVKSRTIKPWRSTWVPAHDDVAALGADWAPHARPSGATLDVHRQGPT